MKISVTKVDIDNGLPRDVFSCPIALAIRRSYSKYVWVNRDCIENYLGRLIDIPKTAQKFIERFDDELPVKPFRFNLKLKRKRTPTGNEPCCSSAIDA